MASQTRFTDIDFKQRSRRPLFEERPRRRRRIPLHWLVLGLSGVTGAVLLTSTPDNAEALRGDAASFETGPGSAISRPLPLPPAKQPERPAPVQTVADEPATFESLAQSRPQPHTQRPPEPEPEPEPEWETLTVRSGDSLARLLSRADLGPRVVHELMQAGEPAKALRRIYPGDEIKVHMEDGDLAALQYRVDESVTLEIARAAEDGFKAKMVTTPLERREAHATAVIDTSLFKAGKRAGLDDPLIMQLAGIFGWDVDFALDIRKGDAFTVVYEELYRDGRKVRNGDIIAAEFINDGEHFKAVRYTDPNGKTDYYSPDGRSMRKPFLRSPVSFTRVSSNFDPQRLHPVLGTKRPHMGTDYAAPPGTPIKASGDGKIVHRGRKGGYGRTVVIKHGSKYSTLYAHMSRYAGGLSTGSRVKQGQIIGYVGSSGLSTGPHLHYEFRVNGTHRNPRTVELPDAEPINESFRADFREKITPLVAQLDTLRRSSLALSQNDQ